MKYIVVLGDGMADQPVKELNHKTPLQCAKKPFIDYLAQNGEVGLVKTIPDGMPCGSDTANLSVMGYDIRKYYTGRSPLEAVSMGIPLADTDVTFRCNLVTLSEDEGYENKTMLDYSADEISTKEANELIKTVNEHFSNETIVFYAGISYRHCMVWKNGTTGCKYTPPHDILEKKIGAYLPQGVCSDELLHMMKKSNELLKNHPVNTARMERGLRPANSIWLWGDGKKPALSSFSEKYGITGAVISAVDLIKGIGICGGLEVIDVEGATGNIHTNFKGKAEATLKALADGNDFVYLHIEAPDECGHRFEVDNKVRSIELIDELVVKRLLEGLKGTEYSILLLPDHPTPLCLRTHTGDPVPYILYRSNQAVKSAAHSYDEFEAKATGNYVGEGHTLMDRFLKILP